MKALTLGLGFGFGWLAAVTLAGHPPAGGRAGGPDDVRAAIKAKADAATKASVSAIAGTDGFLFFVPELRYLSAGPFWGADAVKVSKATKPEYADPLPAILDFKAQLDKKGIDLLIVPVPAKAAIYPDKLVDGATVDVADRIDTAQAAFLKILGDKGVQTLDLTPTFLAYRRDHPDQLLYSKEDTHWSGVGIDVAADAIAAKIKQEPWYSDVTKTAFTSVPTQVSVTGDMVDMLSAAKPGPETLNLTVVKNGSAAIVPDRASPLVLLGDSHNLIYSIGGDMLATGAGFPENLSARIGFVPDVVAVRGSGASPSRINLLHRGDNLAGKKMIVWLFTAREFTEGTGWRLVPVIRPDANLSNK